MPNSHMSDKQERYSISDKTHQEFIDQSRVLALEQSGIVQCGIATCREMFSVYRKNQSVHMLLYTVKGKGWLTSGTDSYLLEPSSLIVVPAGVENGFGIEEEEWQVVWIFLAPQRHWKNTVKEEIHYTLTPIAAVMYASIQALLRTLTLPAELGEQVGQRIVEQIEIMLRAPIELPLSRTLLRLNRVFQRVQSQLHKDWTIENLAALFPCSQAHLHRLCQQHFGHSPKAHLTRMRMEYAARLLVSTDWPIQHVGDIVGYPNPANFSTRFKVWSHCTPREFRKKRND
ncbi:AraC family transcriptional regulator [Vibrio anguillarum]|uniref:AraC family transcriptional regulator n=4 Tax=Vibrionaceae TaxID=641 RepID=A0AAW4AF53_VIBAN|nr:Transcriptional regulator, AraC family [Vibrio anguillarum 775]AGU59639.1 AraC family transcriptional regulator [Vibrio anguillarum M3]AQP37937.1 AraC family transcriptional regulator [Vibrio anguillarum]NNN48791.1 helix-turn-helix domain-containing protein [Vibrio sp. 2-2(8)]OXX39507.1 AraC family transcriptional regulator [Vibrio sp. V09_P4A23P171]